MIISQINQFGGGIILEDLVIFCLIWSLFGTYVFLQYVHMTCNMLYFNFGYSSVSFTVNNMTAIEHL